MADYDDVIVMNKIKFGNFAVRKRTITFHNILCLTTKKMLAPPLNIPFSLSVQWLYKARDLTASNNVIILQIVLLNNFILHG